MIDHAEQMAKLACHVSADPKTRIPQVKQALLGDVAGATLGGLAGAGLMGGLSYRQDKDKQKAIRQALIGGLGGGMAGWGLGHLSEFGSKITPGGGVRAGLTQLGRNINPWADSQNRAVIDPATDKPVFLGDGVDKSTIGAPSAALKGTAIAGDVANYALATTGPLGTRIPFELLNWGRAASRPIAALTGGSPTLSNWLQDQLDTRDPALKGSE